MANEKTLTPNELFAELKKWKVQNPNTHRLDGLPAGNKSIGVFCFINFHGNKYRLNKNTNIHGVNLFLKVAEELGSADKALFERNNQVRKNCLMVNDRS